MSIFSESEKLTKQTSVKLQDINKKLQTVSSTFKSLNQEIVLINEEIDVLKNVEKQDQGTSDIFDIMYDNVLNTGTFLSKSFRFSTFLEKTYKFSLKICLKQVSVLEDFYITIKLNDKTFFYEKFNVSAEKSSYIFEGGFYAFSTNSLLSVSLNSLTSTNQFVVQKIEFFASGVGIDNYQKANSFFVDVDGSNILVSTNNNGVISHYNYDGLETEIKEVADDTLSIVPKVEKFCYVQNYNYTSANPYNKYENRLLYSRVDEDGLFSTLPSVGTVVKINSDPVISLDAAPRLTSQLGILSVSIALLSGVKALRVHFFKTNRTVYTGTIAKSIMEDIDTIVHASVVKYICPFMINTDQSFFVCKQGGIYLQTGFVNFATINFVHISEGDIAYGFYTSETTIDLYYRNKKYFKRTLTLIDEVWTSGADTELSFCFEKLYVTSGGDIFCEYKNQRFIVKA